tara:strand:+ start:1017 stop:1463 length:447 start_codon:yes stop_codon:yes gene_type:complete
MEFLEFIDYVDPWQWMIVAILVLTISILIIGDSFLPLVAISCVCVAIADYLNASLSIQFIVFSTTLIVLMISAPSLLNKKSQLIAEDVNQMIGQKMRLTTVDFKQPSRGQATASNGKIWNVIQKDSQTLLKDNFYECIGVEGISLIVK